MIHGVLHLCGYKDANQNEKTIMRMKEDFYLSQLFSEYISVYLQKIVPR